MFNFIAFFTPNFKFNSPLNLLFVSLVFLGSFSFASIANAFEDDGTWVSGYYYNTYTHSSINGPTRTIACVNAGADGHTSNLVGCQIDGVQVSGIYHQPCNFVNDPIDSYCGYSPEPVEPQSCTELADQNPEGSDVTIEGYAAEICSKGCKAIPALVMRSSDSDIWSGTAFYTTEECNGGFDLTKPDEKLQDEYQHDDQLQNCYDSTGRLTGQISATLTCPQLSVCYDPNSGVSVGTTGSGTACTTGVKYNELNSSLKTTPSTTSSTVTNPDGSTVETKETVTEQTGLDGSTEVVKNWLVIGRNPQGEIVSQESSEQKSTKGNSPAAKCKLHPELPECQLKDDEKATAELSDNCVTPPVCTGDPVGCASVELQWKQLCESKTATEQEFEAWKSQQSTKDKYGVDVDENGMLASLNKGEVNLQSALNLDQLGDNGSAGSCPAPHSLGLLGTVIEFKYDSICSFADSVRPLIIFSSIFLCMVMVRRSVVGA